MRHDRHEDRNRGLRTPDDRSYPARHDDRRHEPVREEEPFRLGFFDHDDGDVRTPGHDHPSRAFGGLGETEPRFGRPRPEFAGKGPKGYIRSDERILDDVAHRLSLGYLDASDIEVAVKGGEVSLTGTVVDRRTRRLAEELIEDCVGVKDVDNRLKIAGTAPSPASGAPTAGKRGSA